MRVVSVISFSALFSNLSPTHNELSWRRRCACVAESWEDEYRFLKTLASSLSSQKTQKSGSFTVVDGHIVLSRRSSWLFHGIILDI